MGVVGGTIDWLMEWKCRPKIICPYCQVRGNVKIRREKQKAGISGAKATGAILTGGLSLLATGLSRKQEVIRYKCVNCKAEW